MSVICELLQNQKNLIESRRTRGWVSNRVLHQRLNERFQRLYPSLKVPKTLKISRDWLWKNREILGLCRDGVRELLKHFPQGFEFNRENLRKVYAVNCGYFSIIMDKLGLSEEHRFIARKQGDLLCHAIEKNIATITEKQYRKIRNIHRDRIIDACCDILEIP